MHLSLNTNQFNEFHRGLGIFGEQVAQKPAMRWYDRMVDDMESIRYTVWAAAIPAISVGSPQRRYRLFFAAHPGCQGMERQISGAHPRKSGSWGWRGEKDNSVQYLVSSFLRNSG